jgi:hypothetical protein
VPTTPPRIDLWAVDLDRWAGTGPDASTVTEQDRTQAGRIRSGPYAPYRQMAVELEGEDPRVQHPAERHEADQDYLRSVLSWTADLGETDR